MKRILSLLIVILLLIFFSACSNAREQEQTEGRSSDQADIKTGSQAGENNDEYVSAIDSEAGEEENHILVVYFSRWGNTDYPDDVDATTSASIVVDGDTRYGTTEYVAKMIAEEISGDLHRIETVQPYTADFDELRDVNHDEMDRDHLPELKAGDLDVTGYDTVFIGYPVWATDVPQAVISFLSRHDLSGKTVIPFCTHDGYGAGSSYRTISEASHAGQTLDGLAIEASDVPVSKDTVSQWLSSIGISTVSADADSDERTAIKITIGDTVLDGVIYDTELAQEIMERLPITVSMAGYGGREYYGGIDFTPQNVGEGQLFFDNGDITYCSTNNTLAIFYAQTDHSNLTMEVIPIGKVTSDLSVFDTFSNREEITFSLSE